MSELAFAKQFLTALDSRPARLSSDNVVDPRTYPPQSAFILPRLPNAKRKRGQPGAGAAAGGATTTGGAGAAEGGVASQPSAAAAGSSTAPGAVTVSLKPMKSGAPAVKLPAQAPTRSIYDIKQAYAAQAGLDAGKIKLLRAKKPVGDSKSLRDVLGEVAAGDEATREKDPQSEIEVEFSVMIMAGAVLGPAAPTTTTTAAAADAGAEKKTGPAVAQGPSGTQVLEKEEFWDDLQGFLLQRLRDQETSEKLLQTFKGAWASSAAKP